jgi:N-acetylglutamate synthase-like GNAT family acetyltransferase|tara:strand:+ start:1271 stop:1708 length:438 start_codon:yes stop_codon:yes gene_type:complete
MEIRRASIFDFSHICALLANMHEEAEIELPVIDSEKFSGTVLKTINEGIVLIAVEEGHMIGSIGGVQSSEWWSKEPLLGDVWFYVEPQSRATQAAINLVKEFISSGKGMKIKLGHIYSGDLDRKDNFFERLGLKKVGTSYFSEAS